MEVTLTVALVALGGTIATGVLAWLGKRQETRVVAGQATVAGLDVLNEALQQDNAALRLENDRLRLIIARYDERVATLEREAGYPQRRFSDREVTE